MIVRKHKKYSFFRKLKNASRQELGLDAAIRSSISKKSESYQAIVGGLKPEERECFYLFDFLLEQ